MLKENKAESLIGNLLRGALLLSILVTFGGALLAFMQSVFPSISYEVFKGEPKYLEDISQIIWKAFRLNGVSLMQLGIFILILNPLLRVLLCLIMFLREGNYLYTGSSLFVLCVLLYSL